jgi:disulfide bond formation protein DsbB
VNLVRTRRLAGGLLAAALAVLLAAYFVEYGLHMAPCELCLIERWPYRLTALLTVVVFAYPGSGRRLLPVALLVMLAGVALAGFHIGVEQGWWPSPFPECNARLIPGQALPLIPAIPCDRPVYLIAHLPLSMAAMDFVTACAFVLAIAAYVRLEFRSFR